MARYQITEADLPYAREFLAAPIGYHSPCLQSVLTRIRGPACTLKYVLIAAQRSAPRATAWTTSGDPMTAHKQTSQQSSWLARRPHFGKRMSPRR